ncbi:hypothetical protein AtEden1_Chr3g0190731 [Arabidopsis thaliana]
MSTWAGPTGRVVIALLCNLWQSTSPTDVLCILLVELRSVNAVDRTSFSPC